ncbi:MAG: acetylornithine carbamoyltransferase [Alphaproteobacteria bacterium]|nr:acetylornithine carbamoyltransferase [Alphaproteobacteria bacterium]
MKHFTTLTDTYNFNNLLQLATFYKNNPFIDNHLGKHKRLGLIFLNPSLRTRLSTQIAASNLGMETIILNIDKDSWALEFNDHVIMNGSKVEHIKEAAPILGNYFDILGIRSFPNLQNRAEDENELVLNSFLKYTKIPIISLESACLHPLQALADALTIKETLLHQKPLYSNKKPKVVLTWAPHIKPIPHCVANSFAQCMELEPDYNFVITNPQGFNLSKKITKNVHITHHQHEALENADFVYVKNWSAYEDYGKFSTDSSWLLNSDKLKITANAHVMHCLPVRRQVEIADEVLDSDKCLVQEQAKNRVWVAQAVIATLLKNSISCN